MIAMTYRVRIQPSGHEFGVEPGETVLDAAVRQGLTLPYGCRNGTCAACLGKVIRGEVFYPDGPPPALPDDADELGQAIFCQAHIDADCDIEVEEVAAAGDIVVRTLPVRVAAVEPLAHDVNALWLRLPAAERLQFLAGQYIDILLRDGRRRSFSLANPPHEDEYLELHVRRVPGGRFSDELMDTLRPKSLLRIEGPLGTFSLRDDPRPAIMVAGGTGFAPMQSIIEDAIARGIERPIHLFWGVRARRDLYRAERARAWAEAHPHIDFTPVLSDPAPADAWDGETGFVHAAVLRHYPDLGGCQVYMSGPPPMIDAGRSAFRAAGLAAGELFFDSFDYPSDAVEGMRAAGVDPA